MGNVEGLMTRTYLFETVEGEQFIYDSELAYTQLLFCAREGVEYDVIVYDRPSISIGTRQVQHSTSWGFIKFDIPFNAGEKVQIIIGDI